MLLRYDKTLLLLLFLFQKAKTPTNWISELFAYQTVNKENMFPIPDMQVLLIVELKLVLYRARAFHLAIECNRICKEVWRKKVHDSEILMVIKA